MSKIDVSNMDLYYGDFHALKNIQKEEQNSNYQHIV